MATETQTDDWVIWSLEHNAWWASDRCGYVRSLARAGRYSKAEALAIEADANSVRREECALPLADILAMLNYSDEEG